MSEAIGIAVVVLLASMPVWLYVANMLSLRKLWKMRDDACRAVDYRVALERIATFRVIDDAGEGFDFRGARETALLKTRNTARHALGMPPEYWPDVEVGRREKLEAIEAERIAAKNRDAS